MHGDTSPSHKEAHLVSKARRHECWQSTVWCPRVAIHEERQLTCHGYACHTLLVACPSPKLEQRCGRRRIQLLAWVLLQRHFLLCSRMTHLHSQSSDPVWSSVRAELCADNVTGAVCVKRSDNEVTSARAGLSPAFRPLQEA